MACLIDPRYSNTFIDANVLDSEGDAEAAAVDEILELEEVTLMLPHSAKAEIEHPHTPSDVQRRASGLNYTVRVTLTPGERDEHRKVRDILQCNARTGKHDRDAIHLVESSKHGGGYFLTNDSRILDKASEIEAILQLVVLRPTAFLKVYRSFENGRA